MAEVFEEYSQSVKNPATDDGNVERGKEVKCPNCGGNLAFDPKTQTLTCEHCGTSVDFDKDNTVKEIDIAKGFEAMEKWDDTIVVRCENCGSTVIIQANEVAKACPYCGTSQIKRTSELAGIKPNAVYAFSLTKSDAEHAVKNYVKRKFFAPIKFKKEIEATKLYGVYEPCFTFDSDTFSRYEGRIGETHTRTVGSGKNRHTETYTVWRNISGTISHFFDDVTVTATDKFDQRAYDKISPFDKGRINVYEKKFLAGFQANHYTRKITDCWTDAKSAMRDELRSLILSRYSYDEVDYLNVYTNHSGVTYKYVLFPVYRYVCDYKNKTYDLIVNGTTGSTFGKTPVSVWKVVTVVAAGLAALAGIIYLLKDYFV